MKRRVFSILLALCMVLTMIPTAFASGNTTEFAGGTGVEGDPYLISTKEHLDNVRNYLDAHFKMVNDIEFTDADFAEGGAFYNSGAGWKPIGNMATPFTGVFDGGEYAIRNLYINIDTKGASQESTVRAGFFGVSHGTIKNLESVNADITAKTSKEAYAGGIVGYAYIGSSISNCYSSGDVYGDGVNAFAGGIAGYSAEATISNCSNSCSIDIGPAGGSVGGIVGYAYIGSSVSYCSNRGNVNGNGDVGGIVGNIYDGSVTNCSNSGSISGNRNAGGIAGYGLESTIRDCYNTGSVSADGTAGGIAGCVSSGTINNCYNIGSVSGEDYAGGIAGSACGDTTITNCCNAGSVSGEDHVGGIVGYARDETTIIGCKNTSSVSGKDYVGGIVGDISDGSITNCCNAGSVSGEDDVGGIVGRCDNYYSICIADCYNTGSVSGKDDVGGIVGWAYGYYGKGFATITNCHNTGSVSANGDKSYAGGIISDAYFADVTNCYNTGSVSAGGDNSRSGGIVSYSYSTTITNCYNTGGVSASGDKSRSGGIANYASSTTITNCYNTGSVSASGDKSRAGGILDSAYITAPEAYLSAYITNCYNTGSVSGADYVGGIVGDATYITINTCYYLNNVNNGAGEGTDTATKCTEAQMQQQDTFDGFDFDTIWTMDGNAEYLYPELQGNLHNAPIKKVQGVTRLAGRNRFDTAFKSADALKEVMGVDKFPAAIVTSGMNFADALAGSYLAAVTGAPILLTDNDNMADVIAYIEANVEAGGTVYALGGTAVVADSLRAVESSGYTFKRLAGSNRFATNLMILEEAGIRSGDPVLVCTAYNFADSLSASALGLPILLVDDTVSAAQMEFLRENADGEFILVGGTGAVKPAVEEQLREYWDVVRLAGNNRFETSVLTAIESFGSTGVDCAVLAYGYNFPDGLCAGPLAYALGAPLILTANGDEGPATVYANNAGIESGFVLGGPSLINDGVVYRIFSMGAGENIK